MSNPRIRKHIRHYPEDSGARLSNTWQAERWLNEIDPTLATPMIRIGHQDYYIHEPAECSDGSIIMPVRWFTRDVGGKQNFFAKAWRMASVLGNTGYVVAEYETVEVPADKLVSSFPQMIHTFENSHRPDPRHIIGM